MDPDATLALVIDSAIVGEYQALVEHAEDLAEWLAAGGARPRDPRAKETSP